MFVISEYGVVTKEKAIKSNYDFFGNFKTKEEAEGVLKNLQNLNKKIKL